MGFFQNKIAGSFLLLLSLYIIPAEAVSQNIYTRNISVENGLPSNVVLDIFKDSRGIVWIGTEAGLCRYDGDSFKTYTIFDGLPGNNIWSITEDDAGDLWFACYGTGISKFDGKTFRNYSTTDGLVNNNVRKIAWSKKSKGLLIGTVCGFSYLKNDVFLSFIDTSVVKLRNLLQVTDFIDMDSTVYLLTYHDNEKFISFSPYKGTFEYLPDNHRFHQGFPYCTKAFITSGNDTIFANGGDGIKIFSAGSVKFFGDMAQIFSMAEDKTGNIWIASWSDSENNNIKGIGGIYRYKDHNTEYFGKKLGVPSQQCFCLYYDENENLLWIGTLDKGIFLVPLSGVEYSPADEIIKGKSVIKDITGDSSGNLWISLSDGVIKKGISESVFSPESVKLKYAEYIRERYSYKIDPEGSFLKYKELKERGNYRFDNPYLKNGIILPDKSEFNPGGFNKLLSEKWDGFYRLFEWSPGEVVVGTNLGIFHLKQNGSVEYFLEYIVREAMYLIDNNKDFYWLGSYQIVRSGPFGSSAWLVRRNISYSSLCYYFRDRDRYWIYNNSDGVFRFEDGKLKRFDNLSGKIDLSFTALTVDKRNNVIAGTSSGIIYILDLRGDSALVKGSILPADGITGSDIRWVLTDNSNRLWFATNRGMNMVDLNQFYDNGKKEPSFFNDENGYSDKKTFKAILMNDGSIAAISPDNLIKFNPDQIIKSIGDSSRFLLDRVEVNFRSYEWKDQAVKGNWTDIPEKGFVLPFSNNSLSFYFHLLQYAEPSKTQYSYKLVGAQELWTEYSHENKAVFTGLGSGRYILKIKGRLSSAPAKVYEYEYPFRIMPPWWKTWWFYSLLLIAAVIAVWMFIRFRIDNIKKESEINQKLISLKLDALKAQMNPHFIFNAFNSIQKYILNKDIVSALQYMSDFAALIRKTLDFSTMEKISLAEEISFLKTYVELEKRRITNLDYTIEIEDNLDTEYFPLPPLLIQPVVENAILHGIRHMDSQGLIKIRFSGLANTGRLLCVVEDNGIGRTKSRMIYSSQITSHSSKGSTLIQQRAALFGVKVTVSDNYYGDLPCGTRVEFIF